MNPSLAPHLISAAAAQLTHARQEGNRLENLGEAEPLDLASAYAIAEEHRDLLGCSTVGWKIGCTSPEAMQILNSPGPFAGRVFTDTVYGPEIAESQVHEPALESEFAFTLGEDLPARTTPYTVDDVKAATASVAPAIEIVSPRFTDFTGVGYLNLVADSGANAGVVIGPQTPTGHCPDLSEVTVELEIDGNMIKQGVGNAIMGDPWRALEWLANHLSERGIGLRSGDLVMSGTCTGIDPLPTGSVATGRYSGLGSVEIRRTQEPR